MLSIRVDKYTPSIKNNVVIKIVGIILYVSFSKFIDCGMSDNIEIVIIIPDENDNDVDIIFSLFFSFRKQGIIPSVVERPAIVVIIKLNVILFIVNYIIFFKILAFYFKKIKKCVKIWSLWRGYI